MKKRVTEHFGIRRNNKLLLLVALLGYTSTLIGITTYQVKSGFFGRVLRPLLSTNIRTPINYLKGRLLPINPLIIDLKHKDYLSIARKRQEALKIGELFPGENDWVNGIAGLGDKTYRVKLKLKGVLPSHWKGENFWSYKLNIRDSNTVFGMKKFAIQHPKHREFMDEWYFHKLMRYNGVISPRYFFQPVVINGKNYPVYAVEENFEKRLIENNGRREGPIFKFSKRENPIDRVIHNISFYQPDNYIQTKSGRRLLRRAERLIKGFLSGEMSASEVFDIDLMAKAYAVADLYGYQHSLAYTNIRYYLNPITGLVEPIPFDNQHLKDLRATGLIGETNKQEGITSGYSSRDATFACCGATSIPSIRRKIFKELEFSRAYGTALKNISSSKWLDDFFEHTNDEANRNLSILQRSYPWYEFNKKNILYENQKYIRSKIRPQYSLSAYIKEYPIDQGLLKIRVANNHSLPVEIVSIFSSESSQEYKLKKPYFIPNREKNCNGNFCINALRGKTIYYDANLELEDKAINSIGDFSLISRVPGTDHRIFDSLYSLDELKTNTDTMQELIRLGVLKVEKNSKLITFEEGRWDISKDLIIPMGYTLQINSGTNINLLLNSSIVSYSPVRIIGTSSRPVIIRSSDSTGQGLAVINANNESVLKNVLFKNLGSLETDGLSYTGSVTFYESDVNIDSTTFMANRSEDSLNGIRSKVEITQTTFIDSFSDALDLDFCSANLDGLRFKGTGNDSIDLSGSTAFIKNIDIDTSGDKGISIGEETFANLSKIKISNSNIGIASKDKSTVRGEEINIELTNIGLASYQKKPEFGPSKIIITNSLIDKTLTSTIVEKGSIIDLNGKLFSSEDENIFESIYGTD